jgi:hypothetical protein
VLYLLFVLVAVGVVIAVFWSTFGPKREQVRRSGPLPPDDDPEFLRRLGEINRRRPPDEPA